MQKTSPMDFCFKLNEECDYFDAQLQQHGKILVSCCDNKWMVLCKYSDGSVWENCITVTDNFMIFVSYIDTYLFEGRGVKVCFLPPLWPGTYKKIAQSRQIKFVGFSKTLENLTVFSGFSGFQCLYNEK